MADELTEPKRGRGRPKTKPERQATPNWKRFNCIYANAVAQVYQRGVVANTATGKATTKEIDLTRNFKPGDCFVTRLNIRGGEQLLDMWPYPDVVALDETAAIELALTLFNEASEEEQYGGDPKQHPWGQYRLYANPVYDVRYWNDGGKRCDKPFVVFHRSLQRLLLTERGTIHRFPTILAAIEKADKLAKGLTA